jgi:hypothetical protein
MLVAFAFLCFLVAAIVAGIRRGWEIMLIAAGLALVTLPGVHLG